MLFGDGNDSRRIEYAFRASDHDVILRDRAQLGRVARSDIDECDGLIVRVDPPVRSLCGMIRQLRRDGVMTPVLLLVNDCDVEPIWAALDAGAGDYVIEPADPDALLTRLRILIRRAEAAPAANLAFHGLEMDRIGHVVRNDAVHIDLTSTEFRLLEQLLLRPGAVVKRTGLLDTVWGGELSPESNVVDVHIANLRRKLRAHGAVPLIRTIRGVGYVLDGRNAAGRARNGRENAETCRCASSSA